MLKRLRIKFIFVAMCAITLVLVVIVGTINVHNYLDINRSADRMLDLLGANGGTFPSRPDTAQPSQTPGEDLPAPSDRIDLIDPSDQTAPNDQNKPHVPGEMSPEAPYETRFFSVTFDSSGQVLRVDVDKIAAIDRQEATERATMLMEKGKTGGFDGNYKYLAVTTENDDGAGTMYLFLDCTRARETFFEFLRASLVISLAGLVVVFGLLIVFSHIIMRPFARMEQEQKRFITDAGHELKTPLTVIGAACEILEYNTGENEWINTIRAQTGRLSELTEKLVFLARMDEDRTRPVMTDFSLSEVAAQTAESYEALAQSTGKSFRCDIAPNLSLHGDMSMIRKMISLLLDNAFKYSDAAGNIVFSVTGGAKSCKIAVSNTTDQLPTGDLNLLFERFYRPDSARNSAAGGHGIGLAVVKSVAEAHRGHVSVATSGDSRITFTVTL